LTLTTPLNGAFTKPICNEMLTDIFGLTDRHTLKAKKVERARTTRAAPRVS